MSRTRRFYHEKAHLILVHTNKADFTDTESQLPELRQFVLSEFCQGSVVKAWATQVPLAGF